MKTVLHLLGKKDDPLPVQIIEQQRSEADCKVEIFHLDRSSTNYRDLLEKIFSADSVHIW